MNSSRKPLFPKPTGHTSHVAYQKRPVLTPLGQFDCLRDAADAYGVTRQCIWSKCKRQVTGWRFADADQATDWLTWNTGETAE